MCSFFYFSISLEKCVVCVCVPCPFASKRQMDHRSDGWDLFWGEGAEGREGGYLFLPLLKPALLGVPSALSSDNATLVAVWAWAYY